MSLMKSARDFFMRHILRQKNMEHRSGQVVDSSALDNAPSSVTLRTYLAGGDPFEDRIEFHLTNSPGVPSGFKEPNDRN